MMSDQQGLGEKLAAAGLPKVTDKRENPNDREIVAYRCPFCTFESEDERVVRAHITREDDSDHKGRNGYLDQLYVQGIDRDGHIVEDVQTDYTNPERREGSVSTSLFPEGATETQKQILQILLISPQLSTSEVRERVKHRFDFEPTDEQINSTRQIFHAKPMSQTQTIDTDDDDTPTEDLLEQLPEAEKDYDDLTETQQGIVDQILEFDDPLDTSTWPRPAREVTNDIGASSGNYYNLAKMYPNLIKRLKVKKDGTLPPEEKPETVACEHCGKEFDTAAARNGHLPCTDADDEETATETAETPAATETATTARRDELLHDAEVELREIIRSAERERDISPDDSRMTAHAEGKLYVAERMGELLTSISNDAE